MVFIYAGFIFFLSSVSYPIPPLTGMEKYHFDWFLHMLEYAVLGWLVIRALKDTWSRAPFLALACTAFALSVLYAASDEWHQAFVPYRDPSLYDWIADAIGAAAGIILWKKRKSKVYA